MLFSSSSSLAMASLFHFFFFFFLARVGEGIDNSSSSSLLRVLCPLKTGFIEFVEWSGTPQKPIFKGFSIEVFKDAMDLLPSKIPYQLSGYGDGIDTPNYDDMITMLVNKEVDVVIGDLTITMERMQKVDFTQPYLQSALVVVVPSFYSTNASSWDFLQPFSWQLWLSILAGFLSTGFVIFILEKDSSPDFRDGTLKRRIINTFWFTSSTIFFSQREGIQTVLGRLVTFSWLLLVLVVTSSYIANLSSILTAVRLSTNIQSFETLKKMTVPVGYQEGSFTYDYLQMLGFNKSRLKPLATKDDFADALRKGPENGGVAAIVDELPYVNTFLSSNCDFTTVGPSIAYFGGLGFAFQKNSNMTSKVSRSILSLAQDGTIHNLEDGWIGTKKCDPRNAVDHLRLRSFAGLFYVIIFLYAIFGLSQVGRLLWLAFLGGLFHVVQKIARTWTFLFLPKNKHVQVSPHISPTNTQLASTN